MSRTWARVHARHSRPTPRSDVASDQPGGRPCPRRRGRWRRSGRTWPRARTRMTRARLGPMDRDAVGNCSSTRAPPQPRRAARHPAAPRPGWPATTPTASTSRSPPPPSRRCAPRSRCSSRSRARRKVTIFGSARTSADDPLYEQARGLAAAPRRGRVVRDHRRRSRDHAGGRRGRRPRPSHRDQHPPARSRSSRATSSPAATGSSP